MYLNNANSTIKCSNRHAKITLIIIIICVNVHRVVCLKHFHLNNRLRSFNKQQLHNWKHDRIWIFPSAIKGDCIFSSYIWMHCFFLFNCSHSTFSLTLYAISSVFLFFTWLIRCYLTNCISTSLIFALFLLFHFSNRELISRVAKTRRVCISCVKDEGKTEKLILFRVKNAEKWFEELPNHRKLSIWSTFQCIQPLCIIFTRSSSANPLSTVLFLVWNIKIVVHGPDYVPSFSSLICLQFLIATSTKCLRVHFFLYFFVVEIVQWREERKKRMQTKNFIQKQLHPQ